MEFILIVVAVILIAYALGADIGDIVGTGLIWIVILGIGLVVVFFGACGALVGI